MTCPSTGSDPRPRYECDTCRDTGLVSFSERGSDGPDQCPDCGPCPVGGPHFFEKIDPRDEKQLGMYGWHCAECGAARGDS